MIVSASRIYSQFTQCARTRLCGSRKACDVVELGALQPCPPLDPSEGGTELWPSAKSREAAGVCLGAQEAPGASSSAVGRGAVHPVKRPLGHAASVVLHCRLAGWDWLNIGRRSAASKSDKIVGVFRPCALHVTGCARCDWLKSARVRRREASVPKPSCADPAWELQLAGLAGAAAGARRVKRHGGGQVGLALLFRPNFWTPSPSHLPLGARPGPLSDTQEPPEK